MEQTIEKLPNFQQILFNTWTSLSQNFNVIASFALELLVFVFYIYTIFLCSFSEINKNGTNNWKITKHQTFGKYFLTVGQASVKISMP